MDVGLATGWRFFNVNVTVLDSDQVKHIEITLTELSMVVSKAYDL